MRRSGGNASVKLALVVVPFPGLALSEANGEARRFSEVKFLNSPRPRTPKANLTVLTAGLRQWLASKDIVCEIRLIDMQALSLDVTKYGEVALGGIRIDKLRVGCSFDMTQDLVSDCDVIGVSANFAASRIMVKDYLYFCRNINPTARYVVGGGDATHLHEYYLRNGADIVVRGEGEVVFRELVYRIATGIALEGIPSISFLDGDGTLVHHDQGEFDPNPSCDDLNPANLDGVDINLYDDTGEGIPPVPIRGPFVSFETSRGCPWRCTFCAIPWVKGRYRTMRPAVVKQHLTHFKEHGIHSILIEEDNVLARLLRKGNGTFVDPRGRDELLEIFYLLKEMRFSWEFANGIEMGKLSCKGAIDTEVIKALHWNERDSTGTFTGCYRQTVPIESVRPDRSNLFPKLKPFDETFAVLSEIVKTGVPEIDLTVIIRPDDDIEALQRTYRHCLEFKTLVKSICPNTLAYFNIYNLALLPGTPDFAQYCQLLAYDIEKDPELTTFWIGGVRSEFFSPEEALRVRGTLCQLVNQEEVASDHDVKAVVSCTDLELAIISNDSNEFQSQKRRFKPFCGFEPGMGEMALDLFRGNAY